MNHPLIVIALTLCCAASGSIATAQVTRSQNADELLQFQIADGTLQTITSAEQWQLRKAEIVKAMQAVMGPFPGNDRRVDLDIAVDEEADAGSYVRRLITYQSEPGSRTPAYLCIPKDVLAGKRTPPPCCVCILRTTTWGIKLSSVSVDWLVDSTPQNWPNEAM